MLRRSPPSCSRSLDPCTLFADRRRRRAAKARESWHERPRARAIAVPCGSRFWRTCAKPYLSRDAPQPRAKLMNVLLIILAAALTIIYPGPDAHLRSEEHTSELQSQ